MIGFKKGPQVCRLCGARLSLLQRMGVEAFCSPEHRADFQREAEQLGVECLQHVQLASGRPDPQVILTLPLEPSGAPVAEPEQAPPEARLVDPGVVIEPAGYINPLYMIVGRTHADPASFGGAAAGLPISRIPWNSPGSTGVWAGPSFEPSALPEFELDVLPSSPNIVDDPVPEHASCRALPPASNLALWIEAPLDPPEHPPEHPEALPAPPPVSAAAPIGPQRHVFRVSAPPGGIPRPVPKPEPRPAEARPETLDAARVPRGTLLRIALETARMEGRALATAPLAMRGLGWGDARALLLECPYWRLITETVRLKPWPAPRMPAGRQPELEGPKPRLPETGLGVRAAGPAAGSGLLETEPEPRSPGPAARESTTVERLPCSGTPVMPTRDVFAPPAQPMLCDGRIEIRIEPRRSEAASWGGWFEIERAEQAIRLAEVSAALEQVYSPVLVDHLVHINGLHALSRKADPWIDSPGWDCDCGGPLVIRLVGAGAGNWPASSRVPPRTGSLAWGLGLVDVASEPVWEPAICEFGAGEGTGFLPID